MDANDRTAVTPQEAMDEIGRVSDRVRAGGRMIGWIWVIMALVTPAFFLAIADGGIDGFWVAVGFMVVGAALTVWEIRRPVVGRVQARVDRPATYSYVGAVLILVVVILLVDPVGLPAWYAVLSFLPSLPCLVAAWLVLRS